MDPLFSTPAWIGGGAGLDVLGNEEEALRRQAAHRISDQIINHLQADEEHEFG